MTAQARRHGLYRACITLYPPKFRGHYRDDLVQQFDDLVTDRGLRRASLRTALDLVITVPNYRLERIMSQQRSATAVTVVISLIATAGVVSFLTGAYPGFALLGVALVVGIAQRSTLARAVRKPVAGLRRRRLTTSAVLAAVFVVCYSAYIALIGDSWTMRETFLAGVGTIAMVAAIVFFIVGLLTPKAAAHPAH